MLFPVCITAVLHCFIEPNDTLLTIIEYICGYYPTLLYLILKNSALFEIGELS